MVQKCKKKWKIIKKKDEKPGKKMPKIRLFWISEKITKMRKNHLMHPPCWTVILSDFSNFHQISAFW